VLIALQLLSTPQGPLEDEPARSFDDEQIVIGRAPNCQVVLPDSLRIISRQHARLTLQRDAVLLTCLSASAPVRVNEMGVPHGSVLSLHSGDVIHIGGFDLRLTMPNTVAPPPPPPPPPPPQPQPPQPIAAIPVTPATAGPAGLPAAAAPVSAAAAVSPSARPGRARLDEWFDLGSVDAVDAADAAMMKAPSQPAALGNVDLDLRSGVNAAATRGGEQRVIASLQQVLAPPAPGPEALAAPAPVVSVEPEVDLRIPTVHPPAERLDPNGTARAEAAPQVPARAHAAPDDEARAALDDEARAAAEDETLAALDDEARAALVQAFLEGAGLAPRAGITGAHLVAPMRLTPAWMRHVGELLRACVEGSLALLHSRSTVKREMRAEVTVIARRQNNPLKFAPDALAALAHLVVAKRSPGFLEPVAALKDAHEDLLVHHLAVVAGMRAAMFELIARLGPDDVLHEEGPPKGLALTLPTLHEAALWRRYRQRHAEMTARLDDDFETVFGREFTKAYEAQARRVREQAAPDDTRS
jgi:type VI secretion system FHA domain protein